MWNEMVDHSLDAAVFMDRCEPRMLEAFVEMERILLATPGLTRGIPRLPEGSFLLCFCEPKCLDCHPLIPLLQMVTERSPGAGLGILPHRGNAKFLESLANDPLLPTLPTVVILSGKTGEPVRTLFGRPEEMDVVTWRTGKGWQALFRWLPGETGQTGESC